MQEQLIPSAAREDPNSIEMARVWIAKGGLFCSLRIGMYEAQGIAETRAWGIIAADLLRHVSHALADNTGHDANVLMRELRASLDNELDGPTSATSGDFVP